MMPKAARKQESAAAEAPPHPIRPGKKQKLAALLVTGDDSLWPQIGADLGADLVLKQLDSIEELLSSIPTGQAAVVLWDARNQTDTAAVLSRLSLHSTRFAVVALDLPTGASTWTLPLQHRHVIAHVSLPLTPNALTKALDSAQEEVRARSALLGDVAQSLTATTSSPAKKPPVVPVAIAIAALLVGGGIYVLTRGGSAAPPSPANKAQAVPPTPAEKAPETADEQVDSLMEKAQQAMNERHFIDPPAGSALALYREVLIVDPANGEAQQGLQRLAEILLAHVQAALDDRKFDVALQFLETVRSIDRNDRRLAALDERMAGVRAELGPAQIMAAVNAQNFERATQLIDEAARAKSLPPAKLVQLRDEVRKHHDDADLSRLSKLIDTRLQQDKLVDPRSDSAAYYLQQARQAGASPAALQLQTQEVLKRITQMVHGAIEQRHLSDADRLISELRALGSSTANTASLQRELNAARAQNSSVRADQPSIFELAQARLAQGKLVEPDGDSALSYVNQLRGSEPNHAGLAQLTASVQAQLVERARAALDADDPAKSQSLLQLAASLGPSPDIDALAAKLAAKSHAGDMRQVVEQSLTRLNNLEINYPYNALKAGIEGWVELSFTVKADGTVSAVNVFNASPAGTFEAAAVKAVGRMKYKPVLQDGKPVPVATQVRLVFRIPKK